jgi:TonB family protein
MALRCLLFSSDEGTAEPILQVLAGLGVEGEVCSEGVAAVEKVSQQSFQIVIIDWDKQPEAALLLGSARERKAAERPLTLAIVSDDLSVPKALQAGANSILRKPLLVNQIKDTLTTAHDLLRAKQESAANAAQAAAAGAAAGFSAPGSSAGPISALPSNLERGKERNLRAGEFLQSAPSAPGGQFVTDSDVHDFRVSSSVEKDLEPVAASVEEANPAPPPPAEVGEVRGLEWYLKTRAGTVPQASAHAAAQASAHVSAAPAPAKPELLGYDQTPSFSSAPPANFPTRFGSTMAAPATVAPATSDDSEGAAVLENGTPNENPPTIPVIHSEQNHEQKKEAELFAYITSGSGESGKTDRPRFRLRGAIVGALVLASLAILAAPQAPWHSSVQTAWARGRLTVHAWLNPQVVTTPQAPIAHEDFGRAGDEYKLPVTETIPDATTDPAQIQVVPVVDPTVKKPNIMGGNTMPAGTTEATPVDPTSASGGSTAGNQVPQPASGAAGGGASTAPDSAPSGPASPSPALPNSTPAIPTAPVSTPPSGPALAAPVAAQPPHSDPPAAVFPSASPASSSPTVSAQPAPQKTLPPHYPSTPGNVPSSLKSQMASTTPEASGNRSAESAMPSIEPVIIAEAAERALLTDQPAPDYPANSSGQPGMVVLQVLIGRDGAVQDAKFLQGSLGFARAAIDGVKRWKFKPYTMNGRPVSVQTSLTISFKPAP